MHIRKTLIAGALALASGVASAHYLPIGATPAHVSPGDVIVFGHATAGRAGREGHPHVCIATTPLRGVDDVERAAFGYRRPTWGNYLLKTPVARAPIKLPLQEMDVGGMPPFVFTHLLVTTMPVAKARRLHIPPLTALNPIKCSTVILVATH